MGNSPSTSDTGVVTGAVTGVDVKDDQTELQVDMHSMNKIVSFLGKQLTPTGPIDRCAYCHSEQVPLKACSGLCGGISKYCEDNPKCKELDGLIHSFVCHSPHDRAELVLPKKGPVLVSHLRRFTQLFLEHLGPDQEISHEASEEFLLSLSEFPDIAYFFLQPSLTIESLKHPLSLPEVPPEDHLRIVCISDTHSQEDFIELPPGDILIHAGDFSNVGKTPEIAKFLDWFGSRPFRHKIVIAGNHDLTLDPQHYATSGYRFHRREKFDPVESRALLENPNFVYLEDRLVEIEGLKIYGTPWQPEFFDWAFNRFRGKDILKHWNEIPNDIDILISHGPPLGYGDRCSGGQRAGCFDLLRAINSRIKPKAHIFGHIHEDYGITTNGHTLFINASTCTLRYRPVQPPIVFDIPKKRISSQAPAASISS